MNQSPLSFQKPFDEDLTALGTDPVPAAPYHDEAWYELEREAIFRRSWLNVGHVCELPENGSFIVRDLAFARASIIIARGRDGQIRAFHNACTHRGTQLTQDRAGKAAAFSCPYHRWTFGTDGRFVSAPDFERFYIADRSRCDLAKVSVDVCAGLIFVNLDPAPAQGLAEFLGSMGEMIETLPVAQACEYDEYVYELDANWKVTFDNFQENYHLRFVHARTNGAPPIGSVENPFNYPVEFRLFGPHRMNTSPGGAIPDDRPKPVVRMLLGRLAAQAMAEGQLGGPHGSDYFIFYPNLYVFGNPTMHFTHSVLPLSAGRSRGTFRFYWGAGKRTANQRIARELALAFAREIHAEDCETIEAAQRGLESGALAQVNFQQQEVMCRHLLAVTQKLVHAYLADHPERARR